MAGQPWTWKSTVMWALCLVLAVAALVLGPMYLLQAAGAKGPSTFWRISYGWSREILAAAHVLFAVAMVVYAMSSAPRRLIGRMTGVAVLLGLWEVLLAVGAVFLSERAWFGPPHGTVTALGALLILGGIGLNLDAIGEKLASPKAPVVLIFTVAIGVGVIAFALIGGVNAQYYARVDYTRAGRYSLLPATVDLLKGLDHEVRVTTLFVVRSLADDTLKREVTDILDEYARISRKVAVRHIDVRRDVKATKELVERVGKDIRLEENLVVFECPDTKRVIAVRAHEVLQELPAEAAARSRARGGMAETGAGQQPEFRFLGDAVFHGVLSVVAAKTPVKLYFVVGHGEKPRAVGPPSQRMRPEQYDNIQKAMSTEYLESGLRKRYYQLETIDLDQMDEKEGIPKDCDVLVISGPWCYYVAQLWEAQGMKPFSKKHADIVRKYLERGGRVFVMIDPVGPYYKRMVGPLLALLKDYGVDMDAENIVFDEREVLQLVGGARLASTYEPSFWYQPALAKDYARTDPNGAKRLELHPSISAVEEGSVVAIEAAELRPVPARGLRTTRLLTTSARSWLLPMAGGQPNTEARAQRVVAIAVEKERAGQPVMVVLGSSNMFIQPIIRFSNARNEDFAQKVLGWLGGEQQSVSPKPTEVAYGSVSAATIRTVQFISVLVIPSVFIVVGVVIWLGRRK